MHAFLSPSEMWRNELYFEEIFLFERGDHRCFSVITWSHCLKEAQVSLAHRYATIMPKWKRLMEWERMGGMRTLYIPYIFHERR